MEGKNYTQFKDFFKNMRAEIKTAVKKKEWISLAGYITFRSAIVIIGIAGVITIFGGAIDQWQKWFPSPLPDNTPHRTISYQRVKQIENKYGQFNTVFSIQVHTPFGDPKSDLQIGNSFPADAECTLKVLPQQNMEFGAGLASTTNYAVSNCTTTAPIIDNGSLFEIRE